jgi:lysophospholipase L1-like esterase
VLALGDSLFRETRRVDVDPGARVITRALVAQGWNPTIVCWGGKDVVWGESQLRTLAGLSAIPDRVVISLGTNDLFLGHVAPAVFAQRVQSLLDFLSASRAPSVGPEVLWVDQWVDLTLSVPKAKVNREHDDMRRYQQFNAALADLCTEEKNCRVVSWSDAVSARADHGLPLVDRTLDGIHLSAAGTALRVKLIAAALAETAAE